MIHKEGYVTIAITLIVVMILAILCNYFFPRPVDLVIGVLSAFLLIIVLQFFRNPKRTIHKNLENSLYAPADGKVVVIEKTVETEYLKEECWQISVFMSPLNVHSNKIPINGEIEYVKYHPGKYLVAWHPKSSTENERTTVVVNSNNQKILLRQIAGKLARRIVCYSKIGQKVIQGEEFGFIKFGSRVDIFLPLSAKILVTEDQAVKANIDLIAEI